MIPARLTLAVFIVFQLADGLITYTAVDLFGLHAEANPLVATWMALAGAGPRSLARSWWPAAAASCSIDTARIECSPA